MRPDHLPTPPRIVGELLLNHPEAASLLARATHWRSLAVWSAATARRKFAAAQAARLAYEALGHLLEPRGRHPINFVVGLLLLVALSAGLVMLDLIELGGLRSVQAALAATAVWLTGAWLGAVAVRQRRWTLVAAITAAAALLGLLLVALHGLDQHPGRPAVGGYLSGHAVFGGLTAAFIIVLTAGAAALIAHLEPAALLAARQRWYRARAAHEKAAEIEQADTQAAAVAVESWLGLVRARVAAIAADEDQLVQATMAFAAALVGSGRSQLLPADKSLRSKFIFTDAPRCVPVRHVPRSLRSAVLALLSVRFPDRPARLAQAKLRGGTHEQGHLDQDQTPAVPGGQARAI